MNWSRHIRSSFVLLVFFSLLTGLVYPLVVYGLGQAVFSHQADGSLISVQGQIIGSSLIGQDFTMDIYFHPRPSYAGQGYDARASGGSNLGPTSTDLLDAVHKRVLALGTSGVSFVPVDLVTSSASGLDPDISLAAAHIQIARVAEARHASVAEVGAIVEANVITRTFGVLGENRLNVLQLNQALDQSMPVKQ